VVAEKKPMKLGELLISAQLLTTEQLSLAIQAAGQRSLPIGKILTMSGTLTELVLHEAIQAQSLVKDKHLASDSAVAALKLVAARQITLDEALTQIGAPRNSQFRTAKLGDILMAAQFVTENQVREAMRASDETGLPLGRILVLGQNLSEEMVSAALTAQVLLRDQRISFEQAIEGLKVARHKRMRVEDALAEQGYIAPPTKQKIKLGELYMLAELILETDLMVSLERGLSNHKPLGQIFLESGLSDQEVLDASLSLQEMVANGSLNALQAARALRQVALQRFSLAQALAEIQAVKPEPDDPYQLGSILQAAGIVSNGDIKKAVEMSIKNSGLFGRMLQAAGVIDDELLNSSLRAQFLLREGLLGMEQAIIALNQCRQTGEAFDKVAQQLGWTFQTHTSV
jgi:hypothetical protein